VRTNATILGLFALALATLAVGAGCDDSVNAVLESNRKITMFATLDMNADTQFVRVIPIRRTIDEKVDASRYAVRSIDLDAGTELQWQDSLITFSNGAEGIVFFSPLRLFPGHTYRLEASGGDSPIITSAETRIPVVPSIAIAEETFERFITQGGFVITSTQDVVWTGLEREPLEIEHWYRFLRTPRSAFDDIRFPFPPRANLQGDRLSFVVNLAADRFSLEDSIDIKSTAFIGLGMRLTILDTEFVPPGGVFDPEVLVQPGTFSNVENGFGFVGSVGRFSAEWELQQENVQLLGYLPAQIAFGKAEADVVHERLDWICQGMTTLSSVVNGEVFPAGSTACTAQ
jgi:hypothetical protein